ncbi:aspartic peptidase domain-containing protein [Xylaria arbuscula]|nr:aspartic peptidase domain-containing protein [Xylaria arbuscula]
MHRVFSLLQLSLWVTGFWTLVLGAPKSARGVDTDPASKGFVTFRLVKKATTSDKFSPAHTSRSLGEIDEDEDDSISVAERAAGYKIVEAQEPSFKNSAGIDQDGTDYSYFAEVELGSEAKKLYMLLDTGASTTWVMGSSCTSKSCAVHNTFGPDDSETYNDTGKAYSVDYGTGSVRGHVIEDTLSLAGLSVTLSFGVANTTSDQFVQFPFDGILGLATSSNTWLSAVMNAKLIDSNIFGISLSRSADGSNDGEIVFGALNPDKYTGDITYSPVKSDSSWTIPMDDITISGESAGIQGRTAYIDTGTSFVFGPPEDVEAMYKLIPGSSSGDGSTYTLPCDTDSQLAFTFAGQSWNVSSKDFVSGPNSDGTCTGNIYGIEYVSGGWLLGDVFLKNVYSVFDADKGRIGFASKAVSKTTEPSTTTTTVPTGTSSVDVPSDSASSAVPTGSTGLNGHETPTADASTSDPTESVQADSPGSKLSLGCSAVLAATVLSTMMVVF